MHGWKTTERTAVLVVIAGLVASLGVACAEADGERDASAADGPPAAPPALAFALDGAAQLTARWWIGDGWDAAETTVEVTRASAQLRSGGEGEVTLEALQLTLAGVALGRGADAPQVVDATLALPGPVELGVAAWDALGERGAAAGVVELELAWALAAGDDHVPLATQTIAAVALRLGLRRRGERWSAVLVLERDGRAWDWADLFELSDLRIEVAGGQLGLQLGNPALAYHPGADRRSWAAMLGLFKEVFG